MPEEGLKRISSSSSTSLTRVNDLTDTLLKDVTNILLNLKKTCDITKLSLHKDNIIKIISSTVNASDVDD